MTEVYVESFFIINFAADFLVTVITSKVLCIDLKYRRATLCAIFGALYAIVDIYFCLTGVLGFVCSIVASVVMCRIAYTLNSKKAFVRSVVIFNVVGMLFGGALTALSNVLFKTATYINKSIPLWLLLFFSGLLCFVFTVLGRVMRGELKQSRVRVEAHLSGKKQEFWLLCDSGNLALDPYSGNPIIIVKANRCKELLGNIYDNFSSIDFLKTKDALRLKFRIVPINTSLGNGAFFAFFADSVYVYIDGKKNKINACFALDTNEENTYDGTDGIFPYSLVSNLV